MTFKTTIERDGRPISLTVEFSFHRGQPGGFFAPEVSDSIEIEWIKGADGDSVVTDKGEFEQIERECWKKLQNAETETE